MDKHLQVHCMSMFIHSLTRTVPVDGQALASTLYVDVYSFTKDTNPGPFIKIISLFLFFWLDTPKRIGFERKTLPLMIFLMCLLQHVSYR